MRSWIMIKNKSYRFRFLLPVLSLLLVSVNLSSLLYAQPGKVVSAVMTEPVNRFIETKEQKKLSIGVANANITPSTPVVMAGDSARTGVFEGVNDSLYAAATVFDDGDRRAVLITADLIGFTSEWWEELTEKIERETGILPAYVLLSPNHNHGGPNTRIHIQDSEIDEDLLTYNRNLMETFVSLTRKAAGNLQPALIGTGTGICKMNINRRALNADGGLRLGLNPYGPVDHEVGVVRMDDIHGTPISIFVNWPSHATVMGSQNRMITGDWPGSARRFIEKEYPDPVIVTVTAGASGDINPIYREKPDFSRGETEEIGIILGREVVQVAREIRTYPAGSIHALQRVITLPGKKPASSWLPGVAYEPGPDQHIRLSLLRVGNILFVGISGELFTEIGMNIKELSPFKSTHVITHCNGAGGYLVTDDAYSEGGYEVAVTRIMSGAEEAIINNLTEMFQKIIE